MRWRKPISAILSSLVPFPAGSATGAVGCIVAQAFGEALGRPVAVQNKAGANGILGAETVKAARGDGIDVDAQNLAQPAKSIDAEIKKWALCVKAAKIAPD